jgi:DNA-binding response OmpR family regulator
MHEAGAADYLTKSSAAETLLAAIRMCASRGSVTIDPPDTQAH